MNSRSMERSVRVCNRSCHQPSIPRWRHRADPQQFQAPTELKPRMKQAVCCLSNSKGDPGPHGSVTPHKAGRAGAECSLGGQRSRTRPRPRTHWYKMFCCIINISFVFGGPFPARTTVSGTSNSPLSHAGKILAQIN